MPVFKPPYGTKDQHVISPAQHFEYRHLVASLVDGGSDADYIKRACADFKEEGAPKDAIGRTETGWRVRSDLGMMHGRRLDSYAAALTKYEEELKAERKQGGA
jgi:hypothetical protein